MQRNTGSSKAILFWLFLLTAVSPVAALAETIVLPPVIFSDIPVDRYEQKLAADAFYDSARHELQQKGYEVATSAPIPEVNLRQTARSLAEKGDRLAVIRIEHYLDAGFGEDSRRAGYLEVYASAKAFNTDNGELFWEGEGHGTSDRTTTGVSSIRMELSLAADEVMRELFATLPAP
ncbi:MAG TPA: hypothetical protein VJ882_06465 [Desulfuromonadales bacterium]|nr:hypothetical protein [Desulfuromonadales bacterium]